MTGRGLYGVLCAEGIADALEGVSSVPGKVKLMSLKTYYSSILARGKPCFPTLEEARHDFKAMLAGLAPIHYA